MKPTPGELIAGVRALLRDVVLPAVDSEQVKAHLRRIMLVLRDTDWNEAAFALLRENAALTRLGSEVLAWSAASPARQAAMAPLQARLAAAMADGRDVSFALAHSRNRELRDALADFVDACGSGPLAGEATAEIRARMATVFAEIAADSSPRERAAKS